MTENLLEMATRKDKERQDEISKAEAIQAKKNMKDRVEQVKQDAALYLKVKRALKFMNDFFNNYAEFITRDNDVTNYIVENKQRFKEIDDICRKLDTGTYTSKNDKE